MVNETFGFGAKETVEETSVGVLLGFWRRASLSGVAAPVELIIRSLRGLGVRIRRWRGVRINSLSS